jgi:hypothetical protein
LGVSLGGANSGIPASLNFSSNGAPDRGSGQCLAGSLTGAVASQNVTEAPKGSLSLGGNQAQSAMAQGSLTVRQTCRAGTKVGHSDPTARCGMAVAQRIKVTPGITGLSGPRVHIDGPVWHLDVGSSHPGAGVGPKGWAVRPLKRYASWV